MSDIKLALTQTQYQLLMTLSQSIPRVFVTDGATDVPVPTTPAVAQSARQEESATHALPSSDLQPELAPSANAEQRAWTTVDLEVTITAVKLHLYDANATDSASLKSCGIARFALNDNALRLKMLSNGAMEAEVICKSFTMGNTFPSSSRFREVIPAAQHDRNQFMVLYSTSGGTDSAAVAVVTIDSPQIIFAVDPVFALVNFFTSASDQVVSSTSNAEEELPPAAEQPQAQKSSLDFRVDLHDVSISVLESDSDSDTQAIQLSIKQVCLSQQVRRAAAHCVLFV